MKKLILLITTLTILLKLVIVQAAPLKLPTRSHLIKLIKEIDSGGLGIAGLEDYKKCDKVSIKTVKILKIGRASSSYYKESGNYIDSHFMVKLKATGTCTFSSFHQFFADLDHDGFDDYLAGTLPIINEPLEVRIGTDSYGDWVAGSLHFAGKTLKTKHIQQHVKNVFMKGKAAMGGKYESRVIINNIPTGKGDGVYHDAFVLSNTGHATNLHFVSDTIVQRAFGAKYRPADWFDLISYSQNKGSVTRLFKKLGVGAKEGILITHRGSRFGDRVAVNCSTYDSGKYFIGRGSEQLKGESICMAFPYDRYKNKFLAVKKSAYGKETNTMPQRNKAATKKRAQKRLPQSTAKGMTDNKRVNEILLLFKKRPKALKAFSQKSKQVRFQLFKRIYERNTKAERRRAFLDIANNLEGGHSQQRTKRSRATSKHSHGGRYHTHKLPSQGLAHRHGNGAIGR